MPYHKDFEELHNRGYFKLEPEGWRHLTIEFGYDEIGEALYFFWRIEGTRHTFKKPISAINKETGGDYASGISEFLESFSKEILGWAMQKPTPEWAKEYINEYNNWIKL